MHSLFLFLFSLAMCANCHGKAMWLLRAFELIPGATWQCLLYVLHDVSNSPPCLLAMADGAHHSVQEIPKWVPLNLSHMQIYIKSVPDTAFCIYCWLEVNFQFESYCHFQGIVCTEGAGSFPKL